MNPIFLQKKIFTGLCILTFLFNTILFGMNTKSIEIIKTDKDTGEQRKITYALKLAAKPITTSEEEDERKNRKKSRSRKKNKKKVSTLLLTEEDVHTELLDPTKEITDFNEFIRSLEKLAQEKKIREYYDEFNRLIDQLSRLSPQDQINQYITILYNNLDASSKIVCYLWNNIIRIYQTHFQAQDIGKKLIKELNTIFDTYIVPYVAPETQQQLGDLMSKYKQSDYLPLDRTLSQFSSATLRSTKTPRSVRFLESSCKSLRDLKAHYERTKEFWENDPLHLTLPQDIVCYTVPKHSSQLIAATRRGIFFHDVNKQEFEILKKPTDAKVRYHMAAQKKKDPSIHVLTTKPRYVPTAALVGWFLVMTDAGEEQPMTLYFRGKRGDKKIRQNCC